MRFGIAQDGHALEVIEVMDQGGGVEELTLWCHTCDPKGEATVNFPHAEYPKWRLAMAAARTAAESHTHRQVPPLKSLT